MTCRSTASSAPKPMMIDEYRSDLKPATGHKNKEIKVKIPLDHHIRLHTVKVVNGQPISQTVRNALEHYFSELRQEMDDEGGDTGVGHLPTGPGDA